MDLTTEFEQKAGLIYLNHAAVAPWPRRTAEAVKAFAEENRVQGSRNYAGWLARERELRASLARLINASSADDVALLKNTSEALSVIAYGIDWQPGENVVSVRQEFPSNRIVWESLACRDVQVRLADLDDVAGDPEDAIVSLCDDETRLLSVSSVQYANGLRLDLEWLGAFCRARGILFCIDAIQSLGALPFDLGRCQADFVVADGHKWMLGPEGLALFYCRAERRDALRLHQFGWHMVEGAGDFDRVQWRPAANATRFECGSPNMLGIHALAASLDLLHEIGLERVGGAVEANATTLIELADNRGWRLLTPREPQRRAGIVTVAIDGCDPAELVRRLAARGVICAARGGGIRFSPHFYTTTQQLREAVAIVADEAARFSR